MLIDGKCVHTSRGRLHSEAHLKNKENTAMITLSNSKISIKRRKQNFCKLKCEKMEFRKKKLKWKLQKN